MKDKISLAGDLGSGKSTVSKILVDKLGAEYYSTGAIVRSIAEKHGMSVVELNEYMETHPEIDREIDDGLIALGSVDKSLIIDSRMAWHFTPDTFKVYLSTDIETSALRIMSANRTGEHAATLEETVSDTRRRVESEKKRYLEQYGVHIKDLSNYSLVIDTTYAQPAEIADAICDAFAEWQRNRSFKQVLISPERLNFYDDAPDEIRVNRLAASVDLGESIPEITVFERDGEFFVEDGLESALAYAFSMRTFLPARLVKQVTEGRKYVKMQNSL
jgi:cytidylate kinase